ncbi:hypothetical protein [Methanosphaera sp.]
MIENDDVSNNDELSMVMSDMDKQLDFYYKTLNNLEKSGNQYIDKINDLEREIDNLHKEMDFIKKERDVCFKDKEKLSCELNNSLSEKMKIQEKISLLEDYNKTLQTKNKYYETLLDTKIYRLAKFFRLFVDKIKLIF